MGMDEGNPCDGGRAEVGCLQNSQMVKEVDIALSVFCFEVLLHSEVQSTDEGQLLHKAISLAASPLGKPGSIQVASCSRQECSPNLALDLDFAGPQTRHSTSLEACLWAASEPGCHPASHLRAALPPPEIDGPGILAPIIFSFMHLVWCLKSL